MAVGDELLLGDIVNGNAAWLGERLAAAGVPVVHSSMVGDDVAGIATAVRRALEDADVVVVTGGLGPTSDDVTRDAVALVAGVPLERQPAMEQGLRDRFAAYGFEMPEAVLPRPTCPAARTVLDNPVGTAPGLRVEVGDRLLVVLPGPPHEMAAVARAGAAGGRAPQRPGVADPHPALRGRRREQRRRARRGARSTVPEGVDLAYLAGGAVVRVRLTTVAAPRTPPTRAGAARGDAGRGAGRRSCLGRDGDSLPAVVVTPADRRAARRSRWPSR